MRAGWWRRLVNSFGFALNGLLICLRTQPNARIHAITAGIAIALGVWLKLSLLEWCAIVGAIAFVWTAEMANTAIEFLVDLVSPHRDPLAGRIKDIAAAAVLGAALAAFAVGALIFVPKLWALVRS